MTRLRIVEDEVRALLALQRGMVRRGYVVETAETAQEAIAVASRFQPEILLTDWLLKGEHGGLQVAERLRQINPCLPVVFVTGLPLPPLKTAAAYLQPCLFLAKSVRLEAIDSALHQALDAFED